MMYEKLKDRGEGGDIFWGSKQAQENRFKVLLTMGGKLSDDQVKKMLDNKTVLDVGTGRLDLARFLAHRSLIPAKLVGIDILPTLKEKALKNAPSFASFEIRDITKKPYPDNSFDYVIGIGIFSLTIDNYLAYVRDMLLSMYKTSKIMTIVSFPNNNPQNDTFVNVTPKVIKELIQNNITLNYSMVTDKENNEFIIYIMK